MNSYVRQKNINLQRKFGISVEEYNSILRKQDGKFAICGKEESKVQRHFGKGKTRSSLAVDHDHKTNRIRGLLCSNCNSALGFFNDDPDLLIKAADYILTNADPDGGMLVNNPYCRDTLKRKQLEFTLKEG